MVVKEIILEYEIYKIYAKRYVQLNVVYLKYHHHKSFGSSLELN